jgi:hypothetical protein
MIRFLLPLLRIKSLFCPSVESCRCTLKVYELGKRRGKGEGARGRGWGGGGGNDAANMIGVGTFRDVIPLVDLTLGLQSTVVKAGFLIEQVGFLLTFRRKVQLYSWAVYD